VSGMVAAKAIVKVARRRNEQTNWRKDGILSLYDFGLGSECDGGCEASFSLEKPISGSSSIFLSVRLSIVTKVRFGSICN
jgi:hypothetical protein